MAKANSLAPCVCVCVCACALFQALTFCTCYLSLLVWSVLWMNSRVAAYKLISSGQSATRMNLPDSQQLKYRSGILRQKSPRFAARVPESGPTCACVALRTSRRCRCLSMHHTLNRNRTNARCTPRTAAGALSRLLASPAAGLGQNSPRLAAECQKAAPPALARLCAQADDADAFLCTIR